MDGLLADTTRVEITANLRLANTPIVGIKRERHEDVESRQIAYKGVK